MLVSLLHLVLGLTTLACTSDPPAPPPVSFDAQRAWSHLEAIVAFGERPSGSAAIERLRVYIEKELRAIGLEPRRETFSERTPIGDIEFANVYADLQPSKDSPADSPLVVLATHVDTKRLPFEFVGANDGGSGTAALLELARCLVDPSLERTVTYRLLFLDGEEAFRPEWIGLDNTYGSRHHVAELRRTGELARVRACVLLDMVGDEDLRLTTDLSSDRTLLGLFFDAAEEVGLGRHVRGRRKLVSDDHLSFLDAGVPSVDLIDLEFGLNNRYWHTPEDVLERCSAESLDAIGRIVLAGLPKLEALLAKR